MAHNLFMLETCHENRLAWDGNALLSQFFAIHIDWPPWNKEVKGYQE
jgi:hypothetical protein